MKAIPLSLALLLALVVGTPSALAQARADAESMRTPADWPPRSVSTNASVQDPNPRVAKAWNSWRERFSGDSPYARWAKTSPKTKSPSRAANSTKDERPRRLQRPHFMILRPRALHRAEKQP